MSKKNKSLSLLNPIEWYYPDYFKDMPNIEEQYTLLTKYRDIVKGGEGFVTDEEKSDQKSFNILNEMNEKKDYFDNVRNIVNQLLNCKDPADLFSSMFPDNPAQIEIYKSQFTDACDIIINKDFIDWNKMNIPWLAFKQENGVSVSNHNYEQKINWNMDYWSSYTKGLFFKFWRDRYSKTVLFMSPAKIPAGGIGFFDAENEASKITTFRFVFYESHKVNQEYQKRRKLLLEEQKVSQPADRYRLQLLLEAERLCWEMWQFKNVFQIKEGDPINYIRRVKSRMEQNEIAFKTAFASLIEYDRSMGLPITDPDRDFKGADPINVAEYIKWLSRPGRVIEEGSDEDIFLKNLKNKDISATPHPIKMSFVPLHIDEFVNEQARLDRADGVVRNKSGMIVDSVESDDKKKNKVSIVKSNDKENDLLNIKNELMKGKEKTTFSGVNSDINLNNDDLIKDTDVSILNSELPISEEPIIDSEVSQDTNEKEPEKTQLLKHEKFKSKSDINDKFSSVLSKIKSVSTEKTRVEKLGYIVIDPNEKRSVPKGNPYLDLFNDDEYVEETEEEIKSVVSHNLSLNKNMDEKKVDEIHKDQDEESLMYDKMLEMIDGKSDENAGDSESSSGDGTHDEKPVWVREGMIDNEEDRVKFKSNRQKAIEKRNRIKSKTSKVFDRNKHLENMKSEWVKFPEIKDEGNFWDVAISKVSSFKESAKVLWKDRVKFNITGNEKNKISIVKNIRQKIKSLREKNVTIDNADDMSIKVYENDVTKKKRKFNM